jgi:hypothetical protein
MDSPVTMRGAHQQCQTLPHVVKPFGLARDDGRRALALLVAAIRRGAVQTRPRRWETHTGTASRRHTSRSRLDSPATMGGAHR